MNIFRIDLKRSIISKNMIIAVFLGLASISVGIIIEPLKSAMQLYLSNPADISYQDKMELIKNSLNKVTLWNFGNYFYANLMPLICCMPFAIAYINDKNTGFNRFIITRSSYKYYIVSKIFTTFISGFLVIFIINTISYIIILLIDSGDAFRSIYYGNIFLGTISDYNFNLFVIIYTIICSFMGGIYSLIALAISSIVNSKLIALVSPFIIYYLGSYIISSIQSIEYSPVIVNKFYCYQGINDIAVISQLIILFILSIIVFLYKTYWSDCFE